MGEETEWVFTIKQKWLRPEGGGGDDRAAGRGGKILHAAGKDEVTGYSPNFAHSKEKEMQMGEGVEEIPLPLWGRGPPEHRKMGRTEKRESLSTKQRKEKSEPLKKGRGVGEDHMEETPHVSITVRNGRKQKNETKGKGSPKERSEWGKNSHRKKQSRKKREGPRASISVLREDETKRRG